MSNLQCLEMINIEPSWRNILADEFSAPYFEQLVKFVRQEYTENVCYPPGKQIFAAFDLCPFSQVKVVIIGQDPYHGAGQAEGLCFSVASGVRIPPSQYLQRNCRRFATTPRHRRKFAPLG